MAGAFAITTTTSSVKLTPARTGQLQFTVTNTSGQQLTVRGVIVTPQGEDKKVWFTIDGQPERSCAPNTALAYKVNIAVPPEAPAGPLIVRFDALGVENPDVYSSQGPSVVLDVPPVSIPSKPFPWWIVAVAVLAVLLLGGGSGLAWYLVHPKNTNEKAAVSPTPTPTPNPIDKFVGGWIESGSSVEFTRFSIVRQQQVITGNFYGCATCQPIVANGGYVASPESLRFDFTLSGQRWTLTAFVRGTNTLQVDYVINGKPVASLVYTATSICKVDTCLIKPTLAPIRPTF